MAERIIIFLCEMAPCFLNVKIISERSFIRRYARGKLLCRISRTGHQLRSCKSVNVVKIFAKAFRCNDYQKEIFKFFLEEEQEDNTDTPARVSNEHVDNWRALLKEYIDSILEHRMCRGVGEVSHRNMVLHFNDFQIE